MNPELIKKLGLRPTTKYFGLTREEGVIIYQYEEDIYFAACNSVGYKDTVGIILVFTEYPRTSARVSIDLILDMPRKEIEKYLIGSIKRQKNRIFLRYLNRHRDLSRMYNAEVYGLKDIEVKLITLRIALEFYPYELIKNGPNR